MNSSYRAPLGVACASLAAVALPGLMAPVPVAFGAAIMLVLIAFATFSPVGALAAVVVALPYFYRPIGIGALEIAASELVLCAAAIGSALNLFIYLVRPDRRAHSMREMAGSLIHNRMVQFLTVVTIAGLVGVVMAYDESARGASLREWRWSLAEPLLFLSLLAVAIRSRSNQRVMAASLIAAGLIAAIHGLVDVMGGGGVAADNVRRLSGPLPHPNALALFMLRPLVLVLALFALLPPFRRALIVPVLVTGLVLVGTFSRGAMIAVGFALIIIAVDAPRRVRLAAGSIAVGILALTAVVAPQRMNNLFEGGSVSLRIDIWSSALQMIRDRPILGYGPDQFFYVYAPRYIYPTAWDERFTSHAHNLLADAWIRLGILGAIAATVALIAVGKRLRSDLTARTPRTALEKAATIALAATLVHGLIDNAYFGHDLAMSAWLLAWLAIPSDGRRSNGLTTHDD